MFNRYDQPVLNSANHQKDHGYETRKPDRRSLPDNLLGLFSDFDKMLKPQHKTFADMSVDTANNQEQDATKKSYQDRDCVGPKKTRESQKPHNGGRTANKERRTRKKTPPQALTQVSLEETENELADSGFEDIALNDERDDLAPVALDAGVIIESVGEKAERATTKSNKTPVKKGFFEQDGLRGLMAESSMGDVPIEIKRPESHRRSRKKPVRVIPQANHQQQTPIQESSISTQEGNVKSRGDRRSMPEDLMKLFTNNIDKMINPKNQATPEFPIVNPATPYAEVSGKERFHRTSHIPKSDIVKKGGTITHPNSHEKESAHAVQIAQVKVEVPSTSLDEKNEFIEEPHVKDSKAERKSLPDILAGIFADSTDKNIKSLEETQPAPKQFPPPKNDSYKVKEFQHSSTNERKKSIPDDFFKMISDNVEKIIKPDTPQPMPIIPNYDVLAQNQNVPQTTLKTIKSKEQFRKIKEQLRSKGVVTNYAIQQLAPGIIDAVEKEEQQKQLNRTKKVTKWPKASLVLEEEKSGLSWNFVTSIIDSMSKESNNTQIHADKMRGRKSVTLNRGSMIVEKEKCGMSWNMVRTTSTRSMDIKRGTCSSVVA